MTYPRQVRSARPLAVPTISISVFVLAACANPNLGDVPFRCNNGLPECPDGYVCVLHQSEKVCVREGLQLDASTTPRTDTQGPYFDAGVDGTSGDGLKPEQGAPTLDQSGPLADGTVASSQILVSEFMANPKAVSDTNGEYLELFNPGVAAVDINGWTLKDSGTDLHLIKAGGPLVIKPKGFLVLGRTADKALNGGVEVGYVYEGFFLANKEDEVTILEGQGKTVVSFSYGSATGFVVPDGASFSLRDPSGDLSAGSSWCTEPTAWTGSAGDKGSPGFSPGCN
jgi:hypothetical protein